MHIALPRPRWLAIILNTVGISLLAYTNMYLFLQRNMLRVDAQLYGSPKYRQTITVAFVTVICCLLVLFVRRRRNHPAVHLRHSTWLDAGVGFFLLLNMLYNPWVADMFGTTPIGWIDWLYIAVAAALFSGVHMLARAEKQHRRAAVLALHKAKRLKHPGLGLHR